MSNAESGLQAANGNPAAWSTSDAEQVRRIEQMPKEVGILLIVAGIGGVLLPGPVGSPFLVLGIAILWPRAFRGVEGFVGRRFPKLHHLGLLQITTFLDDLERRYPYAKSRPDAR